MSKNEMKKLRLKARVSVDEALEKLEISYSMLTKIESDDRKPGIKLIAKMRTLYKCSIDDIYIALKIIS